MDESTAGVGARKRRRSRGLSKYNVHAEGSQGVVVGDHARVEQHLHRLPTAKPFQSPPLRLPPPVPPWR